MVLKVQAIKAFEPRGERYVRHNPHLADNVGSFEEVDFTAFLASNEHATKTEPKHHNAPSYNMSGSGKKGRNISNESNREGTKTANQYQILEPLNAEIDEELYIIGSTLVWSQNDRVVKSFNFDHERQHISTALIGWFPYDEDWPTPESLDVQGLQFRQTSQLATASIDPQRKLSSAVIESNQNYQSPLKRRYTDNGFDYANILDRGSFHGEQTYSFSYSSKKSKSDLARPVLTLDGNYDKRKLQKAVCIVLKDIAKIHFVSGYTFSVHLPFPIHTGRAMDIGVILEKRQDHKETKSITQGGNVVNAPFLVLIHPREEPTVLYVTDGISIDVAKKELRLIEPVSPLTDNNQELRYISTCEWGKNESRLLVTYHKKEMSHYIWRYVSYVYDHSTSTKEQESSTLARKEDLIRAANEGYRSPTTTPVKQTGKRNIRKATNGGLTSTPPKPTTPPPLTRKDSFVQYHDDLSSETDFLHTSEYADSSIERRNHCGAYVELLWSEKRTTRYASGRDMDKKTSVFLAHDLDGSELICIFDKHNNILSGINVTALVNVRKGRGVKAFEMKASAAVPIMSTRTDCFDILLIQEGQIKLWIGSGTHLVNISLPDNIADSDTDMNLSVEKSSQRRFRTLVRQLSISEESLFATDLKDAVYNRVNVVLTNSRTYRITVDFTPKTVIIQDCLTALSYALPINMFQNIRQRFMWHCSLRGQPCSETDTADAEWDDFVSAILCFMYRDAKVREDLAEALHRYGERDQGLSLEEATTLDMVSSLQLGISTQSLVDGIPAANLSQHCHTRVEKWILNSLESCEQKVPEESLLANISSVLLALHILWEDLRLDKYRAQDNRNLGLFLHQLVTLQQWQPWSVYYSDHGIDQPTFSHPAIVVDQQDGSLKNFPPDFTAWIHEQLQGQDNSRGQLPPFLMPQDVFPYPGMVANPSRRKKSLCPTIQKLSLFFNAYSDPLRDSSSVVLLLIAEDYKQADLAKLPTEISKPLYDLLESYMIQPPLDWPMEAYLLIGRKDIAEQLKGAKSTFISEMGIDAKYVNSRKTTHTIIEEALAFENENKLQQYDEIPSKNIQMMRFGHTGLIEQLRAMLDSSVISEITVPEHQDMSDEDLAIEHQTYLTNLSHRTLALAPGRGILSFGTCTPDPTKAFPIPGLVLTTKVLPMRTVVQFDTASLPKDYMDWPSFHNGVAAGMRIAPDVPVNGSWILYNKPEELNPEHGGFLLALGLTGHLRRLPLVDWYRYLTENCDLASAGFILGVAAAYCGSRDGKVTKLLSMHLPSLLPLDSTDLGHSHLTQTTCILGIGLVYMGSCDRRMAAVMVEEIGRSNDILPEQATKYHPESRSLTAGFALGFITLGLGDNAIGLADLGMKENLFGFMDEKLALPNAPGFHTSKTNNRSGRRINLDVTAPGAMVAIGLMYLKTEDVRVAEKIGLPDTLPMLDYIRPDFLLLRVLSRNLIMWSQIKPSENWINDQLPEFIKSALNEQVVQSDEYWASHCDMEVLQQAACNIITGCCVSIGLRYAGSRNEKAFKCLLEKFDYFAKRSQSSAANFQQKITRSLMKACRDIVATAAAMVMAGTGNQELHERLSVLHERVGPDVTYGSHMAIHMASGLLFIGGGKYTLGTSNLAIATLLCSFYPFFPTAADDNMYHLQAFRHLWALALECRWLIPREIESDRPCQLPLTLTVFDDDPSVSLSTRKHKDINAVAPLVVPDFGLIKSIKVDSPRYWPIVINMQEHPQCAKNIIRNGILYVKRKPGHETYDSDPKGRRSVK
ncbi:hypothetical protein NQZ79_g837 [Umbelopsis isabellina]|nr:hypothetical protein NQZ79_g837 [Umbelopsis isabellina]